MSATASKNVIPLAALKGACAEQMKLVKKTWPDGIPITAHSMKKALKLNLDLQWAATKLLTDAAQKTFNEGYAALRKTFNEGYAALRKTFNEDYAALQKTFNEDCAALQKTFNEDCAALQKTFNEDCAALLFHLLKIPANRKWVKS